jgi:hypothetical protein
MADQNPKAAGGGTRLAMLHRAVSRAYGVFRCKLGKHAWSGGIETDRLFRSFRFRRCLRCNLKQGGVGNG